ncbi:MAG TPA: transposase [Thermoanaerobaculia bacterium]
MPLFRRRTREVGELLPQLYLHGLAQGDFELALRGLLGEGVPLSPNSIERLRGKWVPEFEAWSRRDLRGIEPVYLWADGIYVKTGLEKDKTPLLVIVAGLRDGRKVVLAVESGYRESAEAWGRLLRDLRARGMSVPRLVIADENRSPLRHRARHGATGNGCRAAPSLLLPRHGHRWLR